MPLSSNQQDIINAGTLILDLFHDQIQFCQNASSCGCLAQTSQKGTFFCKAFSGISLMGRICKMSSQSFRNIFSGLKVCSAIAKLQASIPETKAPPFLGISMKGLPAVTML